MREDIINKVLQIINANIENTEITFEQTEDDLSALGMDSIVFIPVSYTHLLFLHRVSSLCRGFRKALGIRRKKREEI